MSAHEAVLAMRASGIEFCELDYGIVSNSYVANTGSGVTSTVELVRNSISFMFNVAGGSILNGLVKRRENGDEQRPERPAKRRRRSGASSALSSVRKR